MLVGILHTASTTTYGLTNRHVPMQMFQPHDTALVPRRVAWKDADRTRNHWVIINATDDVGRMPRGELVKVIGPCGDWEVEKTALVQAQQMEAWPKILPPIVAPDARPLLDMPFVNIDPPGCVDVDDAVAIVGDRIAIAIADVSAWIDRNPWMASAAARLGQTMQAEGKAVRPMLPPTISEDRASLRAHQRRPAVVLTFRWRDGAVDLMDLFRCDIVVRQSQTQSEARHITEFPIHVLENFTSQVLGEETDDPHKWVEALMVFQNKTAAFMLVETGEGLLRSQSEPDAAKLTRQAAICPDAVHLASSAAVQVPATEGLPHFRFGEYQTHVTSPLRRWADVINQAALFGHEIPHDLEALNARDKHLKKYNRDLAFLEALQQPIQPLGGIVLEQKEDHCRVFVTAWRRVVSIPRTDLAIGERVLLKQHLNMEPMSWKRRLVLEAS